MLLLADDASVSSNSFMAQAVAVVLRVPPENVVIERLCANCGSTTHGQPLVRDVPACGVSFSRVGRLALAAASANAQVGVDIESIAAVAAYRVDNVLASVAERAAVAGLDRDGVDRYFARLWVAKEAVTKLAGIGLRSELTGLELRLGAQSADLVSWPEHPAFVGRLRVALFELSDDVVGALATTS